MKKLLGIFVFFVILAGCNRPAGPGNENAVPPESPLVVDRPAAVVLNPVFPGNGPVTEKRKVSLEKILSPLNIPVIVSGNGSLEFVKNNGDRVRLEMKSLQAHYDLVLFNAVNDPVPCSFKDLGKKAGTFFTPVNKPVSHPGSSQVSVENHVQAPDTAIREIRYPKFPEFSGKQKVVVISIADTAESFVKPRNISGIRWVEQRVDTKSSLKVTFENDLITYANTDRYFTNGVSIGLQAAWIGRLRLSGLMIPYRHTSGSSYSLKLVQNMYTPTDTRVSPALHNDRPYASYLYLGYGKVTTDPFRKIRLTNEFNIGYTGPYSAGSTLQTLVHESFPTNDKPLGWETQIKTALILNYDLKAEKAIVSNENLMLAASAAAKAGTLYNQAGVGFRLQAGKQEPYFGKSGQVSHPDWQYYFFMRAEADFIAYDATLEGGMTRHNEVFRLTNKEISHLVASGEAGFQLVYKGTGLEIAQHYLSPEYKNGFPHKWGRISLIFNL